MLYHNIHRHMNSYIYCQFQLSFEEATLQQNAKMLSLLEDLVSLREEEVGIMKKLLQLKKKKYGVE